MKKGLLIPLLALIATMQAKADWSVEDGTLTITSDYSYNYAMSYPWYSQRETIKNVIVEDGVKSIGKYAFQNYSELSSINISSSVEEIAQYAFNGCSNLTSVSIPNGVEKIGSYAFELCSNLSVVYLPNSITSYGFMAFYNYSELSVHAESITTPAEILGDDVFNSDNSTIYIAKGTKETFVAAWGNKFTYEEVESIDDVIAKIEAIGIVENTESCKALIDEAKEAFDALSDEQKALVTNAETLAEAIATYESFQYVTNINESFYKRSNDNSWYDLLGNKYNTKPTIPGLYIHQGKRVLVK